MIWSNKSRQNYTAAIIIIGNEILSGRTQDSNINFLAKELSDLGIPVMEAVVIPDDQELIVFHVNRLRKKYTYTFTTGGIGPTHDDITTNSIAKAFGVSLYRDEGAVSMIKKHYKEAPGMPIAQSAFKMADLPKGARIILNEVSGAPGFKIDNVFVMAGVPSVMQSMFNYAKVYLKIMDQFISRSLQAKVGESVISDFLGQLQSKYKDLTLGSYPFMQRDRWYTHLVVRGQKISRVNSAFKDLIKELSENGIEYSEIENKE